MRRLKGIACQRYAYSHEDVAEPATSDVSAVADSDLWRGMPTPVATSVTDLAALRSVIGQILRDPDSATAPQRICAAVAAALPCDGAALTLMGSDTERELLYSSDQVIDTFERTQFNLGEGPSLRAFTISRPVLIPDMTHRSMQTRWPILQEEIAQLPLGGVFCFPIGLGAIRIDVLTLYRRVPRALDDAEQAYIFDARDLLISALLDIRASRTGLSPLGLWLTSEDHRSSQVAQATGMLIVQLGVPVENAFARLRAHAYSEKRDVAEVADDIVHRRIQLERDFATEE